LIGGASTRMGQPKALLLHEGTTFLERVIKVAQQRAQRVCLLGNGPTRPAGLLPDRLPDSPGLKGPLAGILAALRWAPQASWLILACDLPQLSLAAIDWLINQRAVGRWAVLPQVDTARVEPLLALYEPQALRLIETLGARDIRAPRALAAERSVFTPLVPAGLQPAWLNVNTADELRRLHGGNDASPSAGS